MGFDWSKVEGYHEDMSADEKLLLLDNFDMPNIEVKPENDPAPSPTPAPKPAAGFVTKAQFDKVSSELAKAKKDLRAKMSADEQNEADRLAAEQAMKEELETLRKEKQHSVHKASFLAQGYDEVLAEEAASAMTDGDMEGVFAAMKKHSINAEKALRAQILKESPVPPAGDDPNKKLEEERRLRGYFGLTN